MGGVGGGASAEVLNRWVQYGADDTVFLRSISSAGDACPTTTVDGATVAMAQRFAPGGDYPITMCEASLPLGSYSAKVATIGGVSLKMPVADPKRILVIGDTGCRVLGTAIQDCNNVVGPLDFPLNFLSNYAALFKPDLIVHTGDFYYREAPCPAGNAGCAGSPFGETWASWNADWFAYSKALQLAAPMALTRGNHESCDRGAVGWFHLLAVQPYSDAAANCGPKNGFSTYRSASAKTPEPANRDPNDTTPSYVVQAGKLALIMFDGSYANDGLFQPTLDAAYTADLNNALAKTRGKPAFFVAHKPIYGLNTATSSYTPDDTSATPYAGGGNANEQKIFGGAVPPQISLFVSGHTHNFQVVDLVSPNFAPQLVIGNSGTLLDGLQVDFTKLPTNPNYKIVTAVNPAPPPPNTGIIEASRYLTNVNAFGFAVLDATPTGYVANVYNLTGSRAGRCLIVLNPRSMTCTP